MAHHGNNQISVVKDLELWIVECVTMGLVKSYIYIYIYSLPGGILDTIYSSVFCR